MRALLLALAIGCRSNDGAEPLSCKDHKDCPNGSCTVGVCKPLVGSGGACRYSYECGTEYCDEGTCTSGALGTRCSDHVYCQSRACVDKVCVVNNVGASCDTGNYNDQCQGQDSICIRKRCRPAGVNGSVCDLDAHCRSGLQCIDEVCLDEQGRRDRTTRIEESLLEQSGVKPQRTAEKTVRPPGAGQRVRTAKVKGKGRVFAACRDNERLVGGGCSEQVASFPTEFSTEDTVGARWNCTGGSDELVAYALCQQLP